MLINDFYNCKDIQQAANEYGCQIFFNENHSIFTGHFPGQPVVPGVCMMEMVKELLEDATGSKSLILRTAGNVKFLRLITPNMQPSIKINWKENEAGYAVNASFNSPDGALFKLVGNYEKQ